METSAAKPGELRTTCSEVVARKFSLPCELEAVRESASQVRGFLQTQGVGEADLMVCEVALVEACNNAVSYASLDARKIPVEIELTCEPTMVELQVIDHGPGFDWPETFGLPPENEEHGRGLFIIQSLMNETFYLRGRHQNRLIMRKGREAVGELKTAEGEPARLEDVQQKLALSEHVIGTMAKEICFRSEELAAIFRSTSELGPTNDLDTFSQRLLNDLLHITGAEWFVLRFVSRDGKQLELASASASGLILAPIDLVSEDHNHCAERRAVLSRKDVVFDSERPLPPEDPLRHANRNCRGLVKPIFMGKNLVGTLAVGRKQDQPPFSTDQVQVIHTFSEFLAIQTVNIRLQEDHVDHRLTARELEIARNIQRSLLPKKFPLLPGFGLAGFCRNARQVGGDFYDILPLTEDKVLLVVADVMGKGVPAALFAATLHTFVRTMAEWTHRPAELLARVNRLIYDELSGVDMFITVQLVLLDARKRHLTVASAGHCPLLVRDREGGTRAISPEGMPLGIMPEVVFEEERLSLDDCSCALLYTDGLTEARNSHGDFFGQERLLNWLQDSREKNQTAAQLSDGFLAELKSFQSQVSISDDQTLLLLVEESPVTAQPEDEPEYPRSLASVSSVAVSAAAV
jgi:serine phosphatase RsbU (regulator of sigma subunit)/anti-sigma regulatory factor (Ser/Thr protein kinase)